MPQSMLTIRERLRTVASIRKITNAMKLIASSRYSRSRNLLDAALRYGAQMDRCLADCFHSVDLSSQNLPTCMQVNDTDRDLYIIVSSTLGLCGGYNNDLFKLVVRSIRREDDALFIGEKGFRRFKETVNHSYTQFLSLGESISFDRVNNFRHELDSLYRENRYRYVYIVYTQPINSMSTRPVVEKLFPLSPVSGDQTESVTTITFDPDPQSVTDLIVPHWLDSKLYRCLLQSIVSEQTNRRNSMDSATDSADDLTRSLKLEYNKIRQAKITQEITEVISGSNA